MARHEIKTGRIGPNQLGTKHDGLGPGWPGPAQFPALVITKEKGASLSFFPRQREGDGPGYWSIDDRRRRNYGSAPFHIRRRRPAGRPKTYRPNPSEACDVTSFRLTTLADVVILGCVLWNPCLRTIHSFLYLNTCRSFNFLLFIEQKKIQTHSCKTQLVHTIQKLYNWTWKTLDLCI